MIWSSGIFLAALCLRSVLAIPKLPNQYDAENFFHFVTRPDIGAPKWHIEIYDQDALQPGYSWFVSPYAKLEQMDYFTWNGPHIYSDTGELIWSGAPFTGYINAFDFRVSHMDGGKPVLSFVWPKSKQANGWTLDDTYTPYKLVDMVGEEKKWNMHDFNLIDDGKTVLMLFPQDYDPTPVSVPGYNGSCRAGWQGFKEVDVNTNETLFKWNDRGHVSVEESTYVALKTTNNMKSKCADQWDITHFNAIDKFDDGDYLLSARHTDTVYKISHINGSILWRLGGKHTDFVLKDQRASFTRQHHARFRGQNDTHTLISVFDNAVGTGSVEEQSSGESWGLHLALRTDVRPMEVSLIGRYEKPVTPKDIENPLTKARGSMSFLPNGNVFMGWAVNSHISEHTPDGRLLMHARVLTPGADSYRSYKMPWKGYPALPPDVVSQVSQEEDNTNLTTTVYVSWNGATEVATWKILHVNTFGNVTELVASSPKQGFETKVSFDGYARHVVAVGLDVNGHELGRSEMIETINPDGVKGGAIAVSEQDWQSTHTDEWWTAEEKYQTSISRSQGFWFGVLTSMLTFTICLGIYLRRTGHLKQAWSRLRRSGYKNVASMDEDELEELVEGDDGDEKKYRDSGENEEAKRSSTSKTPV